MQPKQQHADEVLHLQQELQDKIEQLEQEVASCKEREQRALSDYQNLLRRTQQNTAKLQQLAATAFVEELLEPLSHLELAKKQLKDSGLEMVVQSIWTALEKNGLVKIAAMDKDFNLETMEVVQKGESGQKVIQIVQEGYTLNGVVIKHAKVILD